MKISHWLRPLSLSFRLVSFMGITSIVAFLTFSMIMIYSVEKHFAEQDIIDLKKINTTISRQLAVENSNVTALINKIRKVSSEQDHIFIYLQDQDRNVIYESANSPDFQHIVNRLVKDSTLNINEDLATGNQVLITESAVYKNVNFRVMVSSVNVDMSNQLVTYILAIAMSTDFHIHYLKELKSNLIIAAFFICLMIIFLVLFSVYQGHAPLRFVSKKIASITSEKLNTRLQPDNVPIELRQLVISFNTMLEKIEDVFNRQSNFSADIAHEIRTPITNLMTQTQFALNQPRTIAEYQELLYSNIEEYDRMAKMVGDMLFLSQADNNQLTTDNISINLKDEVNKVFEYFEAWAEDNAINLQLEGDAVFITGDLSMLRRVINNLLSNAIRYTPKGEAVTVVLTEENGNISMKVSNPGEQIPPEHLSHLFDRLYRVDKSRQRKGEGSGIGLAIVKSIVEAHRGRVSVSSDSQSTDFYVILPKNADVSVRK